MRLLVLVVTLSVSLIAINALKVEHLQTSLLPSSPSSTTSKSSTHSQWFTHSGNNKSSSSSGSSSTGSGIVKYNERTLKDFATRSSRTGFIRKVYSIFISQMLMTFGMTAFALNIPSFLRFLQIYMKEISVGSSIGSLLVCVSLCVIPNLRYKTPINGCLLALHTLFQSLLVAAFSTSAYFSTEMVCLGTVHTLFAFLAITLYSFQPNPARDLTTSGNILLTSLSSLVVGSFLAVFFKMPLVDNLISAGLAIVFAVYIGYDTQMIVGGKHHKLSFGENEYILASLNLYQDVISMFMQIMRILKSIEDSKNRNYSNSRRL